MQFIRPGVHQGNWQLQFPRKIANFKQATGFQINRRSLRKLTFDYLLTSYQVGVFFRPFRALLFCKSDNNIDRVIIWRWLRGVRVDWTEHWVPPFFRDNVNSGAYIVSKEFNQDPELFKSFYRTSTESFSLLVDFVGPEIRRKDTNFRTAVSAEERLLITLR
jgi:hypothetical protein